MISLNLSLDLDSLRSSIRAESGRLVSETVRAVEAAGVAGKATARVMAPHRSYELRDSIDAHVGTVSAMGAEGEIVATADHASMVVEGTKPHIIEPRRKRMLRFEGVSGTVFARRVRHPGTAPNPEWWKRAEEAAERVLDARCEAAVDAMCARLSAA